MDAVSTDTFRLTLFGHFELAGRDGSIHLTRKKLAALLAFLARTAPEPHGRDKLMALFWGSHFEAQARQNLRQALRRLRCILGPHAFITDGETVSLRTGVIECDVTRFETLVRARDREALIEATELYRDRFLADIVISEEAWTEWLRFESQKLEDLAVDALIALADQHLHSHKAEHALSAAKRAIAINGVREDAHRMVMRAMAATGNRGLALKHYDELVDLLRHEFDVEPDAATLALSTELRHQPGTVEKRSRALPAHPDRPSIAVLPFLNLSPDPQQKYFADGLVEILITALSRMGWLSVIRGNCFAVNGQHVDVTQVGQELGVRYLLQGSVCKGGDRMRLSSQLVNVSTRAHLWAGSFDGTVEDALDLQDIITARVISAIAPKLEQAEIERSKPSATRVIETHDTKDVATHYLPITKPRRINVKNLPEVDWHPGCRLTRWHQF
jgi:TolB-like protein